MCIMARDIATKTRRCPSNAQSVSVSDHELMLNMNQVARGPAKKSAEDTFESGDLEIMLHKNITDCATDALIKKRKRL